MARRVTGTSLNARTIDILNVIRSNATAEYQELVPKIDKASDIPAVGEVLFGYPALANQFLNALVNRIALVRVKSATFNNMYADLKKGYLEFGETIEEVFVNIAKAVEFSSEKAEARELKRTLPDVRSAFHCINWRVTYPVTIEDEQLRMAFLSAEGVTDLIANIVDSVSRANEYDEYLLFKYLIIKAVAHGKMKPVSVNASNISNMAISFRSISNQFEFLSPNYNISGVHTNTKKEDQYIFMDADFNARFDVSVLASAFNMDKANFMGNLKLIDSFTTFDNARFDVIRANGTQIEEVTAEELALMKDVKAVIVDKEWFQFYDNQLKFTEKYVASGEYWNYFLHSWKTVSSSPFSNAVAFVTTTSTLSATPDTIEATVETFSENADKDNGANSIALTTTLEGVKFKQTEALTKLGVAVHPYGLIMYNPAVEAPTQFALECEYNGVTYKGTLTSTDVGTTVTLSK